MNRVLKLVVLFAVTSATAVDGSPQYVFGIPLQGLHWGKDKLRDKFGPRPRRNRNPNPNLNLPPVSRFRLRARTLVPLIRISP